MSAEPEYAEPVSTTLSPEERRAKRWNETKMDFKWATALLFVLILALSGMLWNPWSAATAGQEDLTVLTELLFSPEGLVAPFEVLGVLLLAALIAAGIMGARDPGRAPEDAPYRARREETDAPLQEREH